MKSAVQNVTAILSMLHEPSPDAPHGRCSATRLFRGDPVLRWTLDRLTRSQRLGSIGILCWEDQLPAVTPLAEQAGALVLAKGPRSSLPEVEAIAAAQRWADGWRGGLLSTCHFDRGFYAPWHHELAERAEADAIILVDPSAGLIDSGLIDGLIDHAQSDESLEFFFQPVAPGLGTAFLRPTLLNRLAAAKAHPGRILHYDPNQNGHDLLTSPHCAAVPAPVARTLHRFTLDSDRQVARISAATESLNGQLISTNAEDLVHRLHAHRQILDLPREVVLELTTRRATEAIFRPGSALDIDRPDLSLATAKTLFRELSTLDSTRLTLSGAGDPLLHPDVFTLLDAAAMDAGLHIHLETDLLDLTDESLSRLANSPVDVISVHIPALTQQTYAHMMGGDALAQVLDNIRRFITDRQSRRTTVPILVPVFTKCRDNLAEMEAWYDQWLRALGSAVITGPSDYAAQIPDPGIPHMTPPKRTPCARLASRLTILSDATVVACEQDILGKKPMGNLTTQPLRDIWQKAFPPLRSDHESTNFTQHPLCAACRDWHRP
jgi:radical SAM family protein/iron-sulfur cluster protein